MSLRSTIGFVKSNIKKSTCWKSVYVRYETSINNCCSVLSFLCSALYIFVLFVFVEIFLETDCTSYQWMEPSMTYLYQICISLATEYPSYYQTHFGMPILTNCKYHSCLLINLIHWCMQAEFIVYKYGDNSGSPLV
jgi:hypothetical protein